MLRQINGHWVNDAGRPIVVDDERVPVVELVNGEQRVAFADVPRAIPAANPFDPSPEPAWIGEAMQAKREELRADGVACDEIEPILQLWAKDALPVEDHRPDPNMPSGEGWRLQPRDPETGQWVADEEEKG